ncbi:UDP-galactopyranose mutase [Sphingomonas sp.]|jgi:UDP-galactopyranose mutase|uniref:UDP-galactopyranose mutase n=1 Tax=Sphingomonas sp. TaxID=28214 RepID=UPI002ED79750
MIASDAGWVSKLRTGPALPGATVLCFSHLRWAFVFQRPQHLMSRFASAGRVIFWEEPNYGGEGAPRLDIDSDAMEGVVVVTPRLPEGLAPDAEQAMLKRLLDGLIAGETGEIIRWYYTPMMLPFSEHVEAQCVVYDCMDELANFKNAPPELIPLERRLLANADLVFTGGYSLYEAKRDLHPNIHPLPSSVDVAHFLAARSEGEEPRDQAAIAGPRFGFYGVVDERMDLALLAHLADARPSWSIVVVGPVVKIDSADLPRRANLHYLGGKSYDELPAYLRGWDVALMPFAINESTRFISPTKTPEYLAAGRPVVSTPITDVIRHYGKLDGVHIADTPDAFVAACDAALELSRDTSSWLPAVDVALGQLSWDRTFGEMSELIALKVARDAEVHPIVSPDSWPAERTKPYDVMVVGAGFAGAVMAERLAADGGKRVLVVDRRPHVGGNAYDVLDEAGVLIHQYGPHIFHTNSDEIVDYLSRFTEWRPYEHRVLADVDGQRVPMPINRTTLNMLYGLDLQTDEEAEAYLASRAEPVASIQTSADVVISKVGRELYETFFRGYTRKQWGMDPSELDKSVTARVPTRTNTDDRYFGDSFQAMPAEGYTRMFERMLDHPNIDLLLGVDYLDVRAAYPHAHLVFTGPIDEYFDHRYGKLPYRSLEFRHETLDQEWYQPVAVVNFPSEAVPHTRITEYKHLTGQVHPRTSITHEIPSAEGDPYYPIPRPENQALFKRYEALALGLSDVTFVGRLATYRYYNMDQVVGQALATYRRMKAPPKSPAVLSTVPENVLESSRAA